MSKRFFHPLNLIVKIKTELFTSKSTFPCENPCCLEMIHKHDDVMMLHYYDVDDCILLSMAVCKYCTLRYAEIQKLNKDHEAKS